MRIAGSLRRGLVVASKGPAACRRSSLAILLMRLGMNDVHMCVVRDYREHVSAWGLAADIFRHRYVCDMCPASRWAGASPRAGAAGAAAAPPTPPPPPAAPPPEKTSCRGVGPPTPVQSVQR